MKINFPVGQMSIDSNKNINGTTKSGNVSFMDFLNNALNEVNKLQVESEKLNQAFAMGMNDNIHQVLIASEKADIALQFTVQIRNKLFEAYQEIMRMPI
jgi:flagellar hook-basal body complex protein FliE